jgi:hypothetical protein
VQSVLLAGVRFRRRQVAVLPLQAEPGERASAIAAGQRLASAFG